MKKNEITKAVRDRYGRIAEADKRRASPCCCSPSCGGETPEPTTARESSCCCGETPELAEVMGYSSEELASVPEAANMGLGCGNPQAIASLREGETVLDLGSGAGLDCFLSAARVGPAGRVIGVDMTEQMIERARANAARADHTNVEFRLGEIEHLPVEDESVDVIISNCVINLCPDKEASLAEAFRVLKPGGRLAVSDVVAIGEMPEAIKEDPDLYSACVAGAVSPDEYARILTEAGFTEVDVAVRRESRSLVSEWSDEIDVADYAASASITARKTA